MRSAILAIFLLLLLVPASYGAKIDTSFKFSTIETRHFSIHYHQGLEAVARKAALFAEEAHDKLVDQFLWQPAEKTQLVLIDDSDFTNGLAVTVPYNTIYAQVEPPSLISTLGEYDDWLRELITHEYAHIITSDPARGYWKVTRAIFGKPLPWLGDPFTELMFLLTAPPNTFMPRWWHEGMATWSESEFSAIGRGKGTFFDMVFRSAVAENNIPSVDQINGDVPYWPDGDLPYMFGFRLQKYIADTYGKETMGEFPLAHSGRFPYFINTPPEELAGDKKYSELYADMVAALKREQAEKIALLSRTPFTPLTVISKGGENLTNPRFSPDGSRIAFTRRDPNDHTSVVISDRTGKKVLATFRRQFSDGSLSWSPDGDRLYFSQAEVVRGFDIYQDLYVYDLPGDRVTRLTRRQRLSEPEVSPDGKVVAAVVSSRGSQNLALVTLQGQGKELKARPVTNYPLQRVSSPHWSPDGRSICYALRDNSGIAGVHTLDVATGRDRVLFTIAHSVEYPIWSRDGSAIFYISDLNGVFNVYAYDLRNDRNYQVSHLLTGALHPDPSPDGSALALSAYSSHGFYIAGMDLDRAKWVARDLPVPSAAAAAAAAPSAPAAVPAPLPSSKAVLPAAGSQQHAGSQQDATCKEAEGSPPGAAGPPGAASGGCSPAEASVPTEAPSPYNPFKTLYPHFWLPRISGDGSDKVVWGAFTAGSDVLSYNSYTLAVDYSPGRSRGYFDLVYNNDYFYPTISFKAHIQPFVYTDLEQRGDYYELNQAFSVEATVPINFLEKAWAFNAGYQILDQQALDKRYSHHFFNGLPVFQGRRDNLFAGVSFNDVLRYPWSISLEEGRNISFLYRRFLPAIGSEQNLAEYSAQYHEYLRLPTAPLKHHVLYLRLSGAIADGDVRFGQQAFQIGGIPSDLNPYPLRGFSERFATGKYVATGTLEYRAPIFYPMRGPGTFPLFDEKVHAALFVDAGEVWDDKHAFNVDGVKVGAGVELRTDITLGYWAKLTPALGFAHGFNGDGENQLYFTVYSSY